MPELSTSSTIPHVCLTGHLVLCLLYDEMPYSSSLVAMPARYSVSPASHRNRSTLTQLLAHLCELLEVGGVLSLVLYLFLYAFKDAYSSAIVIQPPCSLQCALDDGCSGYQIVGEAVV